MTRQEIFGVPHKTRTEKEGFIGVPVDEAFNGRVGLLVERIEGELGVVRDHARLQGEELADDGVVPRVVPVDPTQDIRTIKASMTYSYFLGS